MRARQPPDAARELAEPQRIAVTGTGESRWQPRGFESRRSLQLLQAAVHAVALGGRRGLYPWRSGFDTRRRL
jgi:hypothetical protein